MSASSTYFQYGDDSRDLAPFSRYLREVGVLKCSGIGPRTHEMHYNEGIEFNYVIKGTYIWDVEGKSYQLYPGEALITCPWERHGSPRGILDRGVLSWMILQPRSFAANGGLDLGDWSSLSKRTQNEIGLVMAENKNPVLPAGCNLIESFRQLHHELSMKKLGYRDRVNLLLDSLMIRVARLIQERELSPHDHEGFISLLNKRMDRAILEKGNMDEMAYDFNMSLSSFSRKVKALTGFTPSDYLMEMKIIKAKGLLLETEQPVIYIAAECGFATSQHFSTRFTKRIGVSPIRFRKSKGDVSGQ